MHTINNFKGDMPVACENSGIFFTLRISVCNVSHLCEHEYPYPCNEFVIVIRLEREGQTHMNTTVVDCMHCQITSIIVHQLISKQKHENSKDYIDNADLTNTKSIDRRSICSKKKNGKYPEKPAYSSSSRFDYSK